MDAHAHIPRVGALACRGLCPRAVDVQEASGTPFSLASTALFHFGAGHEDHAAALAFADFCRLTQDGRLAPRYELDRVRFAEPAQRGGHGDVPFFDLRLPVHCPVLAPRLYAQRDGSVVCEVRALRFQVSDPTLNFEDRR